MSQRRNGLPVGLILFVLVLIVLPYLLIVLAGWPGTVSLDDAMIRLGVIEPIAGPPPRFGLPPHVIRWQVLLAGLGLGAALGVGLAIASFGKSAADRDMPASARFKVLAFLGIASLAAYGLNFLLPFPLLRNYAIKLGGMGVVAARDAGMALAVTAATLALFLLYGLAYRLCRGQSDRRLWGIVLLGGLLFAVIAFFVFPITSLDAYDYIALGRITGVHGGNPYVQSPGDYPFDPFMAYASWQEATSPYGPLWETLVGILCRLTGDRLLPNLLVFKGLALAGYLASVLLIAAILRRVAPERALAGTLLFAWNPLVLLEGLPNAHNDPLVVALLLGAFWVLTLRFNQTRHAETQEPSSDERFWKRVYGGVALIVLGAAVLVKLIPLLFFPLFLLFLLADEEGWRRRIGVGLLLIVPVLLLAVEYYRAFWHWPEIVSVFGQRMVMFRMSIASVTKEALQRYVGESLAQVLVRPFLAAFALAYVVVLVRAAYALKMLPQQVKTLPQRRAGRFFFESLGFALIYPIELGVACVLKILAPQGPLAAVGRFLFGHRQAEGRRPWDVLVGASLAIFILYLLLGNFWFWPWYLILPIALLALAGDERFFVPLLLAACAGEVSHVGWNFVVYWWGISWDTFYRMDALVVFFMVVPALVVYAINLRKAGRCEDVESRTRSEPLSPQQVEDSGLL